MILLLLALISSAYSAAIQRSTVEADHNWKLVFPREDVRDVVESTTTLTKDLNALTISFWVKETKGNGHSGYLYYTNSKGEILLAVYRHATYLDLQVVGKHTHIHNDVMSTHSSWMHIVVTWSGTGASNGQGSFWVNGKKIHAFTNLAKSLVVPSDQGPVYLGKLSSKEYAFRGELAYLNMYAVYITTPEQVRALSLASTDDPGAVMSWADFIQGAQGEVGLVQEFDIYSASYIHLECRATNMTITLTKSAFPHLVPQRASLIETRCGASSNDTHVFITSNLDECGTRVTYTNTTATYTNYIVPDMNWHPANSSNDTPHAIINRGTLHVEDTSLKFHCTYPLLSHDTIPAYAVKTSNFELDGAGRREIEFKIELYHDAEYTSQLKQHEYPLRVDTGERVYVKAVVHGDNSRMAVWVDRCVATPNSDPAAVTKHNLIENGCPTDETIQYHNSTVKVEQRFSFESFRFNSLPSAVVYLHCYIDVCRAGDEKSRCSKGLDVCPR
jgi:hypothetical protein